MTKFDRRYLVEQLAITGKWVPNGGTQALRTLFQASVETFAARLEGRRTRIIDAENPTKFWEVPPARHTLSTARVLAFLGSVL